MSKLSALERVFDETYYRACYAGMLEDGVDAEVHYREIGWKSGLNPNSFFSTKFYLAANPDVMDLDIAPFDHFLASSPDVQPYASPIFDPRYYADANPELRPAQGFVWHYWKDGAQQGRSPSVLFDVSHYRAQLDRSYKSTVDYLTHYLTVGWKQDLSPHPLFDPVYYRSQLSGPAKKIPPLAHYIEAGWRDGLSPHVLFDPAYYARNLGKPLSEPALVHYLKSEDWIATPHYLFSDAFYVAAVENSALRGSAKEYRSGAPLLHYCVVGARYGVPTHPLFNVPHYRSAAERMIRELDDAGSAMTALEADPLRHYCETGSRLGLTPTPLFDPAFYASQFEERLVGDPIRHYLEEGYCVASPHPGVDVDYYARQKPDFQVSELPVVIDLLMTPQDQRISTHPSFDPQYYLDRNSDIRDSGTCPIVHFLEHGMKEGRQPNRLFTYPYAHRLCEPGHPRFANPVDGYFRAQAHRRMRVLFLGHDASLSGAPLVLLAIIKYLSAIADIECITILGRGGPLVDDYVKASLTYIVEDQDVEFLEWNRHSTAFKAEMSTIADELEVNPPALVICNSLETRHLGDYFHSQGFGPLVTLVHEVADPYDTTQLSKLLDYSELSLFVSEYQLNRMRKKLSFDERKAGIVQFGALDNWFGSGDRAAARRRLRSELGLAPDALIVLGCATMNFRKGIDLFAEVATDVLSRPGAKADIHFVWVGGGETHYDSAYYWAQKTIQDAGFDARVHFVGAQSETERYYLAADLFLLTSRADPFPCVIQEAMACALPIVSFEDKSGAAEAFLDSGIAVPFGTIPMADAAFALLTDDRERERRGKRAKALHKLKPTLPEYANAVFSQMSKVAPAVTEKVARHTKKLVAAADDRTTVLIALDSWDYSEANLFAEHVAKVLGHAGFRAELLFVRGQRVFDRNDKGLRPPEVPYSFLYPNSPSPEHVQKELERKFSEARGRTIFVPYSSEVCYNLLNSLPPHVVAMEILHGQSDELLDRAYAFSRYFDHIVCTSPVTAQMLLEANPGLGAKLTHAATSVTDDKGRASRTIELRARKTRDDPISVVCSLPGSIDDALGSVRLARLLRDEGVPFRLTVLADSAEIRAIRTIAADLLQSKVLELVERPTQAQRLAALAAGDVLFAAPGVGGGELALIEALAAGCVLILTQSDPETVIAFQDGVNSYVREGMNLRIAAGLVADLQRDRKRLTAMSRAAYRLFQKEFAGEDRMERKFAQACRKGLANGGQRDLRWAPPNVGAQRVPNDA